jgi:hypothetical protein
MPEERMRVFRAFSGSAFLEFFNRVKELRFLFFKVQAAADLVAFVGGRILAEGFWAERSLFCQRPDEAEEKENGLDDVLAAGSFQGYPAMRQHLGRTHGAPMPLRIGRKLFDAGDDVGDVGLVEEVFHSCVTKLLRSQSSKIMDNLRLKQFRPLYLILQ